MTNNIISSSKRKYILGRWNPVKEHCQYIGTNGSWVSKIDDARSWNMPKDNDLGQYGSNHMPVFVQKVFVTRRKKRNKVWYQDLEKKKITPCKLNHWQLLEGMLQI